MNHASGAVAPEDTEAVQVGDAIWQRAERRDLVQAPVWPVRVVEVLVLTQDRHGVATLVPAGWKSIERGGEAGVAVMTRRPTG